MSFRGINEGKACNKAARDRGLVLQVIPGDKPNTIAGYALSSIATGHDLWQGENLPTKADLDTAAMAC